MKYIFDKNIVDEIVNKGLFMTRESAENLIGETVMCVLSQRREENRVYVFKILDVLTKRSDRAHLPSWVRKGLRDVFWGRDNDDVLLLDADIGNKNAYSVGGIFLPKRGRLFFKRADV